MSLPDNISLSQNAVELVDEAIEYSDELGIEVMEYDNGSTVLDLSNGGVEAGLYYADVSAGGLLSVDVHTETVEGIPMNFVEAWTDNPAALLVSQYAGWHIDHAGYTALASGPARILAEEPDEDLGYDYNESSDFAVVCLESSELPSPAVLKHIADECGVSPETTYALVAPSTTTAGVVQTAARVSEVGVYRLKTLGYDLLKVRTASGTAPVAPVEPDETRAVGVTNDSITYYGSVHLRVKENSDVFDSIPSSTSSDYGTPFTTLFERSGSFDQMDESIFAPASVTVDVIEGGIYTYGKCDTEVLLESFSL